VSDSCSRRCREFSNLLILSSIFMIYTIGASLSAFIFRCQLNLPGNMIGSLFTGPICDHLGRRAGMMTGSVLIMAGAAILTAAQNDSYLLGGRFLLGFGVSIGTSSAPTYALELAPPRACAWILPVQC
jgi:fucose permease